MKIPLITPDVMDPRFAVESRCAECPATLIDFIVEALRSDFRNFTHTFTLEEN